MSKALAILLLWVVLLFGCIIGSGKVGAQNMDMVHLGGRGAQVVIPFELVNDFLIVNVLLNDRLPLRFIIDTGAESTILLDKEVADMLGLTYRRRFTVRGSDQVRKLTALLATGVQLQFSDVLIARHRSILVLEENYADLERIIGTPIHGILGADFLMRFLVEFNYKQRQLILHESEGFSPGKRFTPVPAVFYRHRPYLLLPIAFTDRATTARKLLLDTGASIPILMHTYGDTLRTEDLPVPTVPSYIANGIGGELSGSVGRAAEVQLGKRTLENVITYFQPIDTTVFDFPAERNGILGNKVLKRYNVLIDYGREKVYVHGIGRAVKRKFKYDRSGMAITAGGARLRQFYVARLIPGGPAEAAGLRKGDRIVAVNRTSSTFISLGGLIARFQGKPGRKFYIKYIRQGKYYRTSFQLRELI